MRRAWLDERSQRPSCARARPFHRATRAASRYLFGASGCYGSRRVGYDRRHLSRVPARVIGEAWLRLGRYADLRCLGAGFLAVVSLAPFLPWIGISISFWPADALRVLSGFAGDEDALPRLWRNASIKSTTFSPGGRALAVTGFPARLLLMSSTSAASY